MHSIEPSNIPVVVFLPELLIPRTTSYSITTFIKTTRQKQLTQGVKVFDETTPMFYLLPGLL
jgi:hypothetical protein